MATPGPSAAALRRNWHLMSVLFSVNHGCVTTPLIFASTLLDPAMAYVGSALLYVFTCFCSLFLSAPVVISLGQQSGLFLAMALYSVFVGAFALATALPTKSTFQWVVWLVGSSTGGAAASILWTAQGSYLDRSVTATVEATGSDRESATAEHTSVFAAYYLLFEVAFKLCSSFALASLPPWITFTVCLACGVASTLGVFGLKNFGAAPFPGKAHCAAKLLAALALWSDPALWSLSFTNLTFGFAAAFLNGYVNATYTKEQLGKEFVGYYATATALVAAVLSRIFGVMAVRLRTKGPFILIGSLCFLGIPLLVLCFGLEGWGYWLIIPYVLQGCGRAVYESTNKGVFADFFPGERAQGAFANQMMQSTLSFTLCFFLSTLLKRDALAAIVLVLAGLTFPGYLLAKRLSDSGSSSSSSEAESGSTDEDSCG